MSKALMLAAYQLELGTVRNGEPVTR